MSAETFDIGAEPGRTIERDISRGERAEMDLDNFIAKRHEARVSAEGDRQAQVAWMKSERHHAALKREENRLAWSEYHRDQAERHKAVLESLIALHETEAARLRECSWSGGVHS